MSTVDLNHYQRLNHRLVKEMPEMVRTTLPPEGGYAVVSNSVGDGFKKLRDALEIYRSFAMFLRREDETMTWLAEIGEYDINRGRIVEEWFESWLSGALLLEKVAIKFFHIESLRHPILEFLGNFDWVKAKVEEQRAYNAGTLRFPGAELIPESPQDPTWVDDDDDW